MRKILIGGLGVAGLLATVLALASSPASSQMVIAFQTDTEPGDYTVSWSTQGGCDPSKPDADTTLATDGATGSVTRSVAVPAGTSPTAVVNAQPDNIAGVAVEFSVAVAGHCTYEWSGSFTSSLGGSDGIRCEIGASETDTATAVNDAQPSGVLTITEDVTDVVDTVRLGVGDVCNTIVKVRVNMVRPTVPDTEDVDNDNDTEELIPSQPHSGAILNTTFTVGAQQAEFTGYSPNDECAAVTGETEVEDPDDTVTTDDDSVETTITVVRNPLSDATHTCVYNVGAVIPAGFKAASRYSEGARVTTNFATPAVGYTITTDPVSAADSSGAATAALDAGDCGIERFVDGATGEGSATDADNDDAVTVQCQFGVDSRLVVATRMIYILQNVVGDSGDGTARYSLTENKECAIPHDLPANLESREVGGIQTSKSVTTVELREGFFNISAAVMGRDKTDIDDYDRTFAPRYALNKDGEACSFTASVSHIADGCDAAEDSISVNAVTGADSHGRVIVTFDIGCDGDEEEAMDDGDAAMDDGDDMGDMDGGDGDDMGDMDGGGDAMGPPEDVATG